MKFINNKKFYEEILSKIKDKTLINQNLTKLLNIIGIEDLIKKENSYYDDDLSLEDFKIILNQNSHKIKKEKTKNYDVSLTKSKNNNVNVSIMFGKLKDNNLSVIYCKRLISKNNFNQNELVDFLLEEYYEDFIDLTKDIDLSEENIKKYINKNENHSISGLIEYQKNINFLFNTEKTLQENIQKYIKQLSLKKNLSIELTKEIITTIELSNYRKDLFRFMPLNNEIIDLCMSNNYDTDIKYIINDLSENNNIQEDNFRYIIEKYIPNDKEEYAINLLNKNNIKLKLSKDFLIENLNKVNEITIINNLYKKEKELKEVLELKIKLNKEENNKLNKTIDKTKFYKYLQENTHFDLDFYSEILKLNGENIEQLELYFLKEETSNRNWKKILNKLDKYKDDEKMKFFIISNIPPLEDIVIPEFILEKYFDLFKNKKNSDISDFFEEEVLTDDEYIKYDILKTQLIPNKYKYDINFLNSFEKRDFHNYLKEQDLNQKNYNFIFNNILKPKFNEDELDYFYLTLSTNKNYISKLNKDEFYKLLKNIFEINKKETNKMYINRIDFGYINCIHSYFVEETNLKNKIKNTKEIDYGISL